MNSKSSYLTALTVTLLLLISSCTRKEQVTTVPVPYLANPIRESLSKITFVTGSFNLKNEDLSYYGNFIAKRDGKVIKVKVYGPFGMKSGNITFNADSIKSPILKYVLGFTDTLSGIALKKGNEYEFSGFRLIFDNSGNLLFVSGKDIKIFLNSYKKIEGAKVPFKVRVWYKGTSLLMKLKEVKIER